MNGIDNNSLPNTVNSDILAIILYSQITLKDIFETLNIDFDNTPASTVSQRTALYNLIALFVTTAREYLNLF